MTNRDTNHGDGPPQLRRGVADDHTSLPRVIRSPPFPLIYGGPGDPRKPLPAPGARERVRAIWQRSHERKLDSRRRRLLSARRRRVLAQWLRRTANRAADQRPRPRLGEVFLGRRVAAVQADLYELAWLLENAEQPDPACMASLHQLLANGCDSPLYNPDIHESELRATLYYARAALLDPTGHDSLPGRVAP